MLKGFVFFPPIKFLVELRRDSTFAFSYLLFTVLPVGRSTKRNWKRQEIAILCPAAPKLSLRHSQTTSKTQDLTSYMFVTSPRGEREKTESFHGLVEVSFFFSLRLIFQESFLLEFVGGFLFFFEDQARANEQMLVFEDFDIAQTLG